MKEGLLCSPYTALRNAAEPRACELRSANSYGTPEPSLTSRRNIDEHHTCYNPRLLPQHSVQWKESTRLQSRKNLLRELRATTIAPEAAETNRFAIRSVPQHSVQWNEPTRLQSRKNLLRELRATTIAPEAAETNRFAIRFVEGDTLPCLMPPLLHHT